MTRNSHPRVLSILCAVTVLALSLAGCSREAEDWRSAQAADTVAAYEQFLREHPDSEHASGASTRVTQLGEDEDWQQVSGEDTLQAYQQFLTRHPEGKWTREARIRVENFTIAEPVLAEPAIAGATIDSPAVDSPPAAPEPVAPGPRPAVPAPKPAPVPAVVAAGGNTGVQLGAFSTGAAAEKQWSQIAAGHPQELGGRTHRVVTGQVAAGTVHRLQVPLADAGAARALCDRLKARSVPCVTYSR